MFFSTSIFVSIFYHLFNGFWTKNGSQTYSRGPLREHPFGDLFRISIFICILVALWLPFGTLWAPFWPLLAPFGSILVPVGTLWAPFWSLWAPFWLHFQRLGAILVKINFFGTRSREKPANCRLQLRRRQIFACTLTFLGPERVYCRRQLRSDP